MDSDPSPKPLGRPDPLHAQCPDGERPAPFCHDYLRHSHTSKQNVPAAMVNSIHSFEPTLAADRASAENPTASAPTTATARPRSDVRALAINPTPAQNDGRVSFGRSSTIEDLRRSGSRSALRLSRPLRTARASFPARSSSLLQTSLTERGGPLFTSKRLADARERTRTPASEQAPDQVSPEIGGYSRVTSGGVGDAPRTDRHQRRPHGLGGLPGTTFTIRAGSRRALWAGGRTRQGYPC